MLYRFKSQATADVLMLEANARQLLEVTGKSAGATGIFTVEQIPAALAKLEAAVAQESSLNPTGDAFSMEGHDPDADLNHVGLHRRAAPLIDMLKRALQDGKSVVWGV